MARLFHGMQKPEESLAVLTITNFENDSFKAINGEVGSMP